MGLRGWGRNPERVGLLPSMMVVSAWSEHGQSLWSWSCTFELVLLLSVCTLVRGRVWAQGIGYALLSVLVLGSCFGQRQKGTGLEFELVLLLP